MRTASPADLGFDPARLARLTAAIDDDVAHERYDGAVVLVARRGAVALHAAVGWAERASGRRARSDDVFVIFSISKILTLATVLTRLERGELALTTRVADVIPEFATRGKQRITVAHLLTHTGGLSAALPEVPVEQMGDLDATIAAICRQGLDAVPGAEVSYSALSAHAVLAEMVRRLDGGTRRFRDILHAELLAPLGMRDTALGARRDLAERRVPVVVRDRSEGLFPAEALEAFNVVVGEEAEIPAAGVLSTAADLYRYAEALRRGGELDGTRILAPAMLELATSNHTGTSPNRLWSYARELRDWPEFPAYIGLTFWLRGTGLFPTAFGTLASPGTFGHCGAGSTMLWVDPARELVFVCLTTGLVEETRSFERFQRLSDLVHAAVVD